MSVSFFDASCPKCGKRFGWTNTTVKPACPKCGYLVASNAQNIQHFEDLKEIIRQKLLAKEANLGDIDSQGTS